MTTGQPPASTLLVAAGAMLFTVLATANAGGYRYGVSDQAFYEPAIALAADDTLFPRDRELLAVQTRLWLGDTLFGWVARGFGGDQPAAAAVVYVATLLLLFAAAVGVARALGASGPAAALFVALLTLRHQIARTGANTLESYMHPRMLAFAIGLVGVAWILRRRHGRAMAAAAAAAVIHTTTGLWFIAVAGVAWIRTAMLDGRLGRRGLAIIAVSTVVAGLLVLTSDRFASRLVVMDPVWMSAFADRTYLFPGDWPLHAWAINLLYPVILAIAFRRRAAMDTLAPGERGLVTGLFALAAGFALSVPLTEAGVALAVQLQVNRIFWLLDAVATGYVAWWVIDDLGRRWPEAGRRAVIAVVLAASALRGAYLINVAPGRPLVELLPAPSAWMDAMAWLARQPVDWHVLADPQHSFRYGPSVRIAAHRDTLLEAGKDPAIAIYDRSTAMRVLARGRALAGFEAFTTADLRRLTAEYDLDVFVDRRGRSFDLPVLYENDEFVVYRLR